MKFLNNRYKILEQICETRLCFTYKVIDIFNNRIVLLNILNPTYIPDKFINFLIESCSSLKYLNKKGLINICDFGIINKIDNKEISTKTYYYTKELIEDKIKFADLRLKSLNEVLNFFMKLCQMINCLDRQGYEYNYLNDTNVYYDTKNNGILLKDILSVELSKYEFNDENEKKHLFQENDNYQTDIMKSQIYSLGVILIVLCVNDNIKLDLNKLKLFIQNIQYDNKEIVLNNSIINEKLYFILRKMINFEKEERYSSITELIKDINKTFHLDFKPYEKRILEKLDFNAGMVGRKEEIDSILEIYNSLSKYDILDKLVSIHGEIGIGKTRFLQYLEYILKLKGVEVYSTFQLTTKENKSFFTYFLIEILEKASPETINKYGKELSYFIPELGEKLFGYKNIVINKNDKLKKLTIISKFIDEVCKDKPIVIIVDDLHFIDDYTLELLVYNFSRPKVNNKILFIFSYCDGECLKNEKFKEFLISIKENIKLDILLKGLSFKETGKMIRNILSKQTMPLRFTENIYDYSKGNPLFIEEMLKDIFFRKYIYVHDENGLWYERFDLNALKFPKNMQDIVENQIGELDDESIKILSMMAIFNEDTSLYLINKLTGINITYLCEKINELECKGILCKKNEDGGFVFDFYNKFLKAFLYNSLDKETKKEKHKLAFKILEDSYLKGNKQYLKEIIYHLSKSGNKEKLIYYCTENANNMLNINNRKDAICCFQEILKNYTEDEIDENYLNIMLKIASLYEEENLNLSLDYLNKIIELSSNKNLLNVKIKALLFLISIKLRSGNINYEEINEAKKLLSNVDYLEGKIIFETIKCNIYLANKEYDKSIQLCNKNINQCENHLLIYKFKFVNILINALLFKKKTDEAIKIAKKYFKLCPDKFYREKMELLNWIGIINGDFYENMNEALICFKEIYKTSKNNNLNHLGTLGMINIASIKYSLNDYEKSYELFLKSLDKCKELGYYGLEFYCNIYIADILENKEKISEAYKYYLDAKKYLDKHEAVERDVNQFYLLAVKINFAFGKVDEVKKYLNKLKNEYLKLNSLEIKEFDLFNILFNGYIKNNLTAKDFEQLKIILDKEKNKGSIIQLICNFAIRFYLRGALGISRELIYLLDNLNYDCSKCEERFFVKLQLLKSKFCDDNLDLLYKIAEDRTKKQNNYLLWVCFLFIGDYFYEKNQLIYSATYYFEACYTIIDLMVQIPKELRLDFIKSNNMIQAFSKFKSIYNYYKNGTEFLEIANCNMIINSYQDLESIFLFIINNDLFENKFFKNELKNINGDALKIKAKEEWEVLNSLSCNTLRDLKIFLQGIVYKTASNRAEIIVENQGNFKVIESSNDDKSLPKDLTIINKARDLKHPIIFKENYKDYLKFSLYKNDSSQVKANICIPIIMNSECDNNFIKKICSTGYTDDIKGYIYVESYKYLNFIGEETLKECTNYSKVFGILVDKYNTEISSTIDKLTGTLTRKYLEKSINNCLEYSKEFNLTFSILMFDIDSFKGINDVFGHRRGDFVLSEICKIVKNSIRDTDICGRYGGEEFIVILPETTVEQAYLISERIRKNILNAEILNGKREVTVSLGIANFPESTSKYEELIEKADQALYSAKKTGKNKSIVWDKNCKKSLSCTNKAFSIISGNLNTDFNNMSALMEIIDVVAENENKEFVINKFLEKIIAVIDADSASFLSIENNEVTKVYSRKIFKCKNQSDIYYNKKLIMNAIKSKQSILTIDLCDKNLEQNTLLQNWNSIILCPIIIKNKVKAILYLSVYIKRKEFTLDDSNFLSVLGKILIPRL